jgi:hypothetical protein
LINVAKPKTKPRPRKQANADAAPDPPGSPQTDLEAPAADLQPVQPRPLLFKISLALFIGWLLFLAFVAYRVMFP